MRFTGRNWIAVLIWVAMLSTFGRALDREAFTFTKYDLRLRIEPARSGLDASGTVELRNDSAASQSNVVLQISSTLQWISITQGGANLQFLSQPYTSDVDHTGALTEAIVTLPKPVPPKSSITLNIAYGGTVQRNTMRLTRIGAPEKYAASAEWDEITNDFTVLRGVGYVTWFPIAMGSVNLSEGNVVFDALAAWKQRHRTSTLQVVVDVVESAAPEPRLVVRFNSPNLLNCTGTANSMCAAATYTGFEFAPTFAIGAYEILDRPASSISFLPQHTPLARDYAAAIERWQPLIASWFGAQRQKVQVIELEDQRATSFESGAFVFTPLRPADRASLEVAMTHQLAHGSVESSRPWISEGIAHFMQSVIREKQAGRPAGLQQLSQFLGPLVEAEKIDLEQGADGKPAQGQPLVTTNDALFFRGKAAYVWWMLRDMIGDEALQKALQAYRPEQDTQPAYMQSLLEKTTPGAPPRNLEWFFDDWVYRDRGLPDFRIESAYPRKLLNGMYVVAVTVENLGNAGAEVPVMVTSATGERLQRVLVHAKSKGVVRVSIPDVPTRATVNDGSVPESNRDNNSTEIKVTAQ